MRFLKYMTAPILMAVLCSFWSCDKDEDKLSEAVLASASTLNFEAQRASEKIITVYADADWVAETPDWVTVTPDSGTGVTDVTISVTDNLRGGTPDNPRKVKIVFKGRTIASQAEVLITQDGDKYRDVKEYTIGEVIKLENETVLSVPEAIVMAVTSKGFIASDATQTGNVYVLNNSTTENVSVGDRIAFKGSKSTDTQSLALVECDILETVSSGTATYPDADDITSKIDKYTSDTRTYIAVSGILNGNNIVVDGASYSVNITDAPASMDLTALNGHIVYAKGYYAGLAKPVIRIMVTGIEDKGVAKVIYFSEDFEWLDPWAKAGGAGRTVEEDNLDAKAPQIVTPVVNEVSALDALLTKGYEFLRVTTKTEGECIYLQNNYLKFGKTSYQAGIVLPEIDKIPTGAKPILSFDWCPMRQGSGTIDPVNLIVIVANGDNEVTFDIPESGFEKGQKLSWIRAEVDLAGIPITKDTKITLRQTQWPAATANRWFLDNIEIAEAP